MSMKRYAVFAKKTEAAQKEGDYTIWHFLNDTNDIDEALHWRVAAEQNDQFDDVQVVLSVTLEAKVQDQ